MPSKPYYGFDLPKPTTECKVRPDGMFVTTYSGAMVGPDGVEHFTTMMLWEWEPENGGVVVESCRVGESCPVPS